MLEWFRRDDAGQWIYTVLSDVNDMLGIADLNLRLPLGDVYDDIDVALPGTTPLRLVLEPEPPRY